MTTKPLDTEKTPIAAPLAKWLAVIALCISLGWGGGLYLSNINANIENLRASIMQNHADVMLKIESMNMNMKFYALRANVEHAMIYQYQFIEDSHSVTNHMTAEDILEYRTKLRAILSGE